MSNKLKTKDETGDSELFPVLPLRDIVVFPYMIVPLFVGREKSVRALEEVMRSDKHILLAAQKNAGDDDPATDAPADATPLEELAAFSGRTVEPRWRIASVGALRVDKGSLPVKIDVPGALGERGGVAGPVVVQEAFMAGIPVEFAIDLHGNVAHQACRAGAVPHLCRGHWITAVPDGIEPVLMLLRGLVQVDLIGADLRFQDLRIAGIKGL